jgi:hypothetical protein
VRLAYIDETYTKDQFWVIALVVSDAGAKAIERLLNELVSVVNEAFPEIDHTTEFHGYALDDGREGWEPLKRMPQARADIYRAAIEALCKVPDIMLFRGCVNLKLVSWSDSNDPHDWALKFVFERIDAEFSGKDFVIAICDDVGQREKYREKFREFKTDGTGGNQPRKLESFIDTLHFVPSHHSRLVQAVDLVAYAFRRASFARPANEKARRLYDDLWNTMLIGLEHRVRIWPLPRYP